MAMTCRNLVSVLIAAAGCAGAAWAGPVTGPWPVEGANDTACVAAAAMGGWYATGDTFQDRIEIRDIQGALRRVITRAEIAALAPWMSLDGGPDGPSALGFSATGRLLYILVHDDTTPGDAQPSDVLLRYDISTGALTRQARLELFSRGDIWPRLACAHHKGLVYVGTGTGAAGQVAVYSATANSGASSPSSTWTVPGTGPVHGIAIDRGAGVIYLANETGVYRASTPASAATAPTLTLISTIADVRGLAWGDHYGAPAQRGLYILRGNVGSQVDFIPAATASSATGIIPTAYTSSSDLWHSIAFTADGKLLIGADEDAVLLADNSDTRLPFDAWMEDEFAQVVAFGRGLISPDGEPAGWVIDGDVIPAWSRFHPATPDGAGWTVLLLLMNDHLHGDPNSQAQVRQILVRYAGLATDGIKPVRNADGVYKHWISPLTGNTKATWPDEYATLSTMKIVFGAARAMRFYPDDPVIANAASRIIYRTKNWDAYFTTSPDRMAFKGLAAGGADTTSWSRPFHEGIVYVEQAGTYGGAASQAQMTRWFNRALWPTASFVTGRPITTANAGQFDAAFLSLYPALLSSPYRADAAWRTQVDNVRWSNAAWTDDNAALYSTVFSAGTSPNGYNADSLATNNHPGNVSTFTSLLAMSAFGEDADVVGGYAAYRKGARQTFKTGASFLYRRSTDIGSTFVPDSAGLPDVALGALAMAELISPGSIETVLAGPYPHPSAERCPQDVNGDGSITIDDLYSAISQPAGDLNGDGSVTTADWLCLENWLRRHEGREMGGQ